MSCRTRLGLPKGSTWDGAASPLRTLPKVLGPSGGDRPTPRGARAARHSSRSACPRSRHDSPAAAPPTCFGGTGFQPVAARRGPPPPTFRGCQIRDEKSATVAHGRTPCLPFLSSRRPAWRVKSLTGPLGAFLGTFAPEVSWVAQGRDRAVFGLCGRRIFRTRNSLPFRHLRSGLRGRMARAPRGCSPAAAPGRHRAGDADASRPWRHRPPGPSPQEAIGGSTRDQESRLNFPNAKRGQVPPDPFPMALRDRVWASGGPDLPLWPPGVAAEPPLSCHSEEFAIRRTTRNLSE